MIELTGKFHTANVFTDDVEQEAISQIITLLNQEFAKDSQIRIMPDTHAGAGCTIGTTMTIYGKAVPYMVGVDIGCGMETILLRDKHVELEKLDKAFHNHVPAGFAVRKETHQMALETGIHNLRCKKQRTWIGPTAAWVPWGAATTLSNWFGMRRDGCIW